VDEPRRSVIHNAYGDYCKNHQTNYPVYDGPLLRIKSVPLVNVQYTDRGSGSQRDLSVGIPDVGGNWYYLGQTAYNGYGVPSGSAILVQEVVPNTVLQEVKQWVRVWDDAGSRRSKNYNLWRGVADDPVGFYVLGDFFPWRSE